jgi:hypothetical protein
MAKYGDGVNYAKSIDPSSTNIIDPGLMFGKVRVMNDYATITTQMSSSGYVILGGKLPAGAMIVRMLIGGTMAAFGSSSNVMVGDEGQTSRYFGGVSCAANVVTIGPNQTSGIYYTITGVTDNYIRVMTPAGSAVSTGAIKLTVMYTVE